MNDRINQLKKQILSQAARIIIRHPEPPIIRKDIEGPPGETFTLKEMSEAYIKYCNGQPLTEKEERLAKAKALAVRVCS